MAMQKWKCEQCGNAYDTEEEATNCEKEDRQNKCRHKDAKYLLVLSGTNDHGIEMKCPDCEYVETRIINQDDQDELADLYEILPGEK